MFVREIPEDALSSFFLLKERGQTEVISSLSNWGSEGLESSREGLGGVRRGGGGGSREGTRKSSGTDPRGGRTNGNKNIEPLTDVMAMMSSARITSHFIHQWILRRLPVGHALC